MTRGEKRKKNVYIYINFFKVVDFYILDLNTRENHPIYKTELYVFIFCFVRRASGDGFTIALFSSL